MKNIKKQPRLKLDKYDLSGLVMLSGITGYTGQDGSNSKKADPSKVASAIANPYQAAYEKIMEFKNRNKEKLQNLSPVFSTAGNLLYMGSNQPDEDSNLQGSAIGMGLQGVSLGSKFGVPGAIIGGALGAGAGWLTAKKRNVEREAIEANKYQNYLDNSIQQPYKMKEGGEVEDNLSYISQIAKDGSNIIIPQMSGSVNPENGVPIKSVQTEKGEKLAFADGTITDVKARKKHDKMEDDEITDTLPAGTYVAGTRDKQLISKDKAEKILLGNTPIKYNEFEQGNKPEEVRFSDIFKKEKHTPAELLELTKKKFKTSSKESDQFADITNEENKIGRIPYIMSMIEMVEGKKSKPTQMKKGGVVDKYAGSGEIELDELYKNYGKSLNDLTNKYNQKYSDYFKYARASNAGANLIGTVGTALQSSEINPGLLSNRYADNMFQKVPNYIRESNKSESLAPIYSIARNQGVLANPAGNSLSRLSALTGNAIKQVNATNRQFGLNDVAQDNAKYKYLQDIENRNLDKIANAENRSRGLENYKLSQIAGFAGRALTGDASILGKQIPTMYGLEKNALDSPLNMQTQLAVMRRQQDMMNNQSNTSNSIGNKVGLIDKFDLNKNKVGVKDPNSITDIPSLEEARRKSTYYPSDNKGLIGYPNESNSYELTNEQLFNLLEKKYGKNNIAKFRSLLNN